MPENTSNTENTQAAEGQSNEIKFDEWLSEQDETIKSAYEKHTTGLQNSVKATRQERDDLAKQIKDLSAKVEKGSELEKSLNDITGQLEAAERRAVFAEEAVRPEIGCSNPKAAYLLATAENLFDRKGNPDWAAIAKEAPELFSKSKPAPKTDAGTGTGTDIQKGSSMNDFLRARR